MPIQAIDSGPVYGFGEFPNERTPAFLVVRLQELGRSLSQSVASLPIVGDTVVVRSITKSLNRLARAVGRVSRPILAMIFNVTEPISTSTLKLDAVTQCAAPLGKYTDNNDVLVMGDGAETTEWRLKLLESAEQRVLLSGNYCGGVVFNRCLQVIEQRLSEKPDLEVFILSSEELLEPDNLAPIRDLQEQYPGKFNFLTTPLLAELYPRPRSIENHVKMMVVDEKYWVLGGTGVADHLCTAGDTPPEDEVARTFTQRLVAKAARDMDVIGKGASARTMALEFFKLWALYEHRCHPVLGGDLRNHYVPVNTNAAVAEISDFDENPGLLERVPCKVLVSGPEHPNNACTDEYVNLLNGAEKTVRLAQMNINPPDAVKNSLMALGPDVHVEVITNGVRGNSPMTNHFFAWPNVRHYLPILVRSRLHQLSALLAEQAPVEVQLSGAVYEYDVRGVLYHKKVIVIDDAIVGIGSYNLSNKSDRSDHEIMVSLASPEVAACVNRILDRDRLMSRPVSLERAASYFEGRVNRILSGLQGFFMGPFVA